MEKIITEATAYIRDFFQKDASGHDAYHSIRVCRTALKIAEEERADAQVVALAALLHDVDDFKLSPETAAGKDNAVGFLRRHQVPEHTISRVLHIIEQVSFLGKDSVRPDSLEGKCVQDADRLDALGAIGIARVFAYGGSHDRPIYDPEEKPAVNMSWEEYRSHRSTSVNHFYEKLFLLEALMNTQTGKRLARGRTEYMKEYLSRFFSEWNGDNGV